MQVDGIETLTLMLAFVVQIVIVVLLALAHSSPLMEQVIRECVVELEDITKEHQNTFWGYHSGYNIDDVGGYADGLLISYGSPSPSFMELYQWTV